MIENLNKEKNPFNKLKKYIEIGNKLTKEIKSDPDYNKIEKNYNLFLNKIKKLKYKRILVIAHGGTTYSMNQIITGVSVHNTLFQDAGIIPRNCSISCVLYNNNKFQLVSFPSNKHLEKINE